MKNIKETEQKQLKKGVISCELVQTFLDQFTMNVYIDGVCVHSQHVNNEEFEIIRKERY